MPTAFLQEPKVPPPLDPSFRPAALAQRAFRAAAEEPTGPQLTIALKRPDSSVTTYHAPLLPEDHPGATANPHQAERLFKFLLWQRGAHEVYLDAPGPVRGHISRLYSPEGERAFDARLMEEIYGRPFRVVPCPPEEIPPPRETPASIGGHLEGCRIGFDLGASDIKVAALDEGKVVFSEEIVWEPVVQSDPGYHFRHILAALRRAAAHLPRVDAIGGSAAGVYVDNRVRVASLFRGVPEERRYQVEELFLRLGEEFGVPLVVVNDGEVAALAGALSLKVTGLIAIALGSSEAAGYVSPQGTITGWLNELAFAPIDYSPTAPREPWSGDRGCGATYLSQQAVFRLAEGTGLKLPRGVPNAERLEHAQRLLAAGEPRAVAIWESIGAYTGYALAHYLEFYRARHVLLLGRVTSGLGGELILKWARRVLEEEFPELASRVQLHLPDEWTRRLGQAVAAASLPAL